MAIVNNPYNTYKNTQINTVSRGDLVIMVYDAAIKFIRSAISGIEKNDISEKSSSVDNALSIIHELKMSINYTYNQELASNLSSIYSFITRQITLSNIKNEPNLLTPLIGILKTLKDGWLEAEKAEKVKTTNF